MCIAQRFPWVQYHSFVDVGAAQGDLAVQVAKANPHLAGLGFDLDKEVLSLRLRRRERLVG